jgi:uncharacterized membrane protein YkvA (DUF1232 family)
VKLSEQMINTAILPRLNQLLPEDIHLNNLRIREGYMVLEAQIRSRGEWLSAFYSMEIERFSFDKSGRYITLTYSEDVRQGDVPFARKFLHETETFLNRNIAGKTMLMNVLKDRHEIFVSENRITIQLSGLVTMYPVLQEVSAGTIKLEENGMFIEVTGPPELSLETMEFDWMEPISGPEEGFSFENSGEPSSGELVRIEREHERFYDRLRAKIERYLREKVGDGKTEQLAPYLLLAPDLFVLLARLIKDPRVPAKSKSIVLLAVVYYITPLDIIPELLIGPIGFMDDIILSVIALNKILGDVDESIINEHWNGDENILGVIKDVLGKADTLVGSSRLQMIKNVFKNKR